MRLSLAMIGVLAQYHDLDGLRRGKGKGAKDIIPRRKDALSRRHFVLHKLRDCGQVGVVDPAGQGGGPGAGQQERGAHVVG